MYQRPNIEAMEQAEGVSFCLPAHGLWGLNSGGQVCLYPWSHLGSPSNFSSVFSLGPEPMDGMVPSTFKVDLSISEDLHLGWVF